MIPRLRLFLFLILKSEEFFLLFYLTTQFLLCRHVGEIFRSEKLVVVVKDRIMCHVLVGIGTEQYADGRVMPIRAHKFVVHLYIHIHLTNILIAKLGCLQINENEAT